MSVAEYFCADESRKKGEDIVGTAGNFNTFALIECPVPWAANTIDSPALPPGVKSAILEIRQARASMRPLLIRGDERAAGRTKILVYRRKEGFSDGYSGQEIDLPSLEGAAPVVRAAVRGSAGGPPPAATTARDILVCTHGTNDKCCAKYGVAFYREALRKVADLALPNVRVWQCSHLGGHRFAPTIIDFPEGRFYGALDPESFTSILTRSGDIRCLRKVYRGWAALPHPAQVLERELALLHGWAWLGYRVAPKLLEQNRDRSVSRVEIAFQRPDGSSGRYVGDVALDPRKTVYLVGDCHSSNPSSPVSKVDKYSVKDVRFFPSY